MMCVVRCMALCVVCGGGWSMLAVCCTLRVVCCHCDVIVVDCIVCVLCVCCWVL